MPDAPEGTVAAEEITPAELRLAARNHALPLEALRYDITPAGLHYLLIHYDIPAVDAAAFRLEVGGAVERPLSLTPRRPAGARAGRACRSPSSAPATAAPCCSRGRSASPG